MIYGLPVDADGTNFRVQLNGSILKPDSTLMQLAGPSYAFSVYVPFSYGDTLEGVKSQVIPLLQSGWGVPDLTGIVIILPGA